MSFPSTSTSHSHSVSFGSVAGSQPGVLSWGFGSSSANRNGNGWNNEQQQQAVQWGGGNSRRRRRSSSTPPPPNDADQPQLALSKKFRTSPTTTTSPSSPSNQEDLGKSLASLDQPSLLKVITSLIEQEPHLSNKVQQLLPRTTLDSSLDLITRETRQILSQIPLNSSPDYTFSRMRLKFESFTLLVKKLLSIYVPTTTTTTTTTTLPSPSSEEELYHPTTTMTLLLHLTNSYFTISNSLPLPLPSTSANSNNALQTHLLPNLINSFHVFLTRLSNSVNKEGKILAQSSVKNWEKELTNLIDDNAEAGEGVGVVLGRKALEGVRDRMRKEIGWLIGLKQQQHVMMEGVE